MKTKHFYVSSGICSHKGLFLSLCVGVVLCALGIAFAIELPDPFCTGTEGFQFDSGDFFNNTQISSDASAGTNISSSGISSGASASSQISWGSSSAEADDCDCPSQPGVMPCNPFGNLMGKNVAVIMEDEVVLTGVLQGTCANFLLLQCQPRTTVVNLYKVLYVEAL